MTKEKRANANRDAYNKISEQWREVRGASKIDKCVVDFSKNFPLGAHILDIGCGTGYPISSYLLEQGFKVTGVDMAENMLEIAKEINFSAVESGAAEFILADFLDFSPKEKYDGAIAFDSIFHIEKERQAEIYPKLKNLVKTGGYVLFTHGNGRRGSEASGEMFGEKFFYSTLKTEEVVALLHQNGFVVKELYEDYEEKTTGTRDLLVVAKKAEEVGE